MPFGTVLQQYMANVLADLNLQGLCLRIRICIHLVSLSLLCTPFCTQQRVPAVINLSYGTYCCLCVALF
jgi:hypothetical protein